MRREEKERREEKRRGEERRGEKRKRIRGFSGRASGGKTANHHFFCISKSFARFVAKGLFQTHERVVSDNKNPKKTQKKQTKNIKIPKYSAAHSQLAVIAPLLCGRPRRKARQGSGRVAWRIQFQKARQAKKPGFVRSVDDQQSPARSRSWPLNFACLAGSSDVRTRSTRNRHAPKVSLPPTPSLQPGDSLEVEEQIF